MGERERLGMRESREQEEVRETTKRACMWVRERQQTRAWELRTEVYRLCL